MEKNISKLYLSHLLTGMVFFYGIEKVFLGTIGIDAVGIGAISVTYLIIAVLFDVPSGVLADKWSRKNVLVISSLFLAISAVAAGMSQNLGQYMIAAAIWAVYFVLTSGTYEAITYDSLHELKRANEYSKVLGRLRGLFLLGILIASAMSGFLAETISLRAVYFLSVVPALINAGLLWTLIEPKFHKEIADSKLIDHMKHSIRLLWARTLMKKLSMAIIVLLMLEMITDEYTQVWFIEQGFSVISIGLLTAIWAGSGAIGQLFAHKLAKHENWLFISLSLSLLVFSYAGAQWGVMFFFVFSLLRNSNENIIETEIQDNIDSSVRATTISVIGFVTNVLSIPTMLIFGYVAREYGISTAFQAAAVVATSLSLVIILMSFLNKQTAKV